MRGGFGRLAVELRLARKMSPKEFADLSGLSLSRISDLEHQRATVTDKVVSLYVQVLNCNGVEASELRKRANAESTSRKMPAVSPETRPIQTLLAEYGDRISPKAVAKIQSIIERETGEQVSALFLSSNQNVKQKRAKARPKLPFKRFIEIVLAAELHRSKVAQDTERVDIGFALECLVRQEDKLDYDIRTSLPSTFDGAFAAIAGHSKGHTIVLEEERFNSALSGVHFARHVIAHELAHHFLHGNSLSSSKELYFLPQELAKNSSRTIGEKRTIMQVVDTLEEAEAECFATLFLVPFGAFYKGTSPKHLAADFGEQQSEVERYMSFFKQPAVKTALKQKLYELGQRQHPIFFCD